MRNVDHYFNIVQIVISLQMTYKCMLFKIHSHITQGRKEGNVLFNDALSTFYLRLYGVSTHITQMVAIESNR